MPAPPVSPALTHVEKALADSYRKEIDQEENVWRSLPFFAATLALQIAALFQVAERLPPLDGRSGAIAVALLALAAVATLTALGYLAACIYPRKFRYLAPDPEILGYALGLIDDEATGALVAADAETTLKRFLAEQYAVGSQHNRQINKTRERLRSVAGLATILSVFATILLVAVTLPAYIEKANDRAPHHATSGGTTPVGAAAPPTPVGAASPPVGMPAGPARGAGDAGRDQGVVDPEGRTGNP